jgi:hypothetical protein
MRVAALFIVAVLAVLAVVTALRFTRPQDANIGASPTRMTEEMPLPDDFTAAFAAERNQALMRDARERALSSARTDEHERWESLKREQSIAARNAGPLTQLQLAEQRAQRYELENIDRDWAPRVEAEILEKVSQTGVRVLDLRVECRTSICRLELLQRADERSISIPVGLALLQIDELQSSSARQVDSAAGTRVMVSYLARR